MPSRSILLIKSKFIDLQATTALNEPSAIITILSRNSDSNNVFWVELGFFGFCGVGVLVPEPWIPELPAAGAAGVWSGIWLFGGMFVDSHSP